MNQEQNNFNNQNINNGMMNNQPLPNNQNLNNSFNSNVNVNSQPMNQPFQQPINQVNVQQPIPQSINSFESGNLNNQNSNNKPSKKVNIGLIIGIVVAILVIVVIVILLLHNKSNTSDTSNNNSTKQFAENVIMNHATINNVKLSEINTINDIMEKLNVEINWVMVCYKETESEEGCPNYSLTEFESNKVEKKVISSLTFNFKIKNSDNIFDFSTYYNVYEEKGYDAPYFSLMFHSNNLILLNNEYVENISMDTIKSKYNISSVSDYWYYIDFESLDGDKYRYTGYPNSNLVEIFNYTERDRGL